MDAWAQGIRKLQIEESLPKRRDRFDILFLLISFSLFLYSGKYMSNR